MLKILKNMQTNFPKKLKTSKMRWQIFQKNGKFEKYAHKFSKISENLRSNISKESKNFKYCAVDFLQKNDNFEKSTVKYFETIITLWIMLKIFPKNWKFQEMYSQIFQKFKA